jgi:ribonuclease P protein component
MTKNATYPKGEKLKGHRLIETLFAQGKSVAQFPLRLVYVPIGFEDESSIKIGVSVSKKYFKKAVDRNYYKRLMRESYRLNKALVADLDTPHAFMLLYQSRERLSFEEVNEKTKKLFNKFIARQQAPKDDGNKSLP